MHANELVRRIITGLHHTSEAARTELLEAVDVAFPEPEADTPDDATPDDGTATNPTTTKAK